MQAMNSSLYDETLLFDLGCVPPRSGTRRIVAPALAEFSRDEGFHGRLHVRMLGRAHGLVMAVEALLGPGNAQRSSFWKPETESGDAPARRARHREVCSQRFMPLKYRTTHSAHRLHCENDVVAHEGEF